MAKVVDDDDEIDTEIDAKSESCNKKETKLG
jgi:hypothetical protein